MATLIKTRRRINSIKSTRKVTNAMELIATAKLKRFKSVMNEGNTYASSLNEVMSILSSFIKKEDELLIKKETSKNLYIIVNSNLGLCASYNNDIFKYASTLIKEDDEIIPIGLKGYNHYKTTSFKINEDYVNLNDKIDFNDINKFSSFILSEFNNKKYDEVYIVYMDFINTLTYKTMNLKLLPFKPIEGKDILLPPRIEPNAEVLMNNLISIYLANSIYQAIVISQVSEQASRRNAMKNATDNADEILDKLQLEYNKARQGAITQEITEVVSGANE